jgi:hypothetical protein
MHFDEPDGGDWHPAANSEILRGLEIALDRGMVDGRGAAAMFEHLVCGVRGVASVHYERWPAHADTHPGRDPRSRCVVPVACGDIHYGALFIELAEACSPGSYPLLFGVVGACLGAILHAESLREENALLRGLLRSQDHDGDADAWSTTPIGEAAAPSRKRVEVARMVRTAGEVAAVLFGLYGQSFGADVPDLGLTVDVDEERMTDAVACLLTNAALCTPPGGQIEIEATRDDGWAVVAVRDNGLGIRADLLPHVFEGLTSWPVGHLPGESHDRGLERVKRTVELHGGSISVHSDGLGTGTTFTVRLPLASSVPAVAEQPPGTSREAKVIRPDRLLVIARDGHAGDRIVDALEARGLLVRTVCDPECAAAVAAELRPDLVVMDVQLPTADREELARRIRGSMAPTLEVVAIEHR